MKEEEDVREEVRVVKGRLLETLHTSKIVKNQYLNLVQHGDAGFTKKDEDDTKSRNRA